MPKVNKKAAQTGGLMTKAQRCRVVSRIETARELAGYSVSQLALAADVDQGYVSKILKGKFQKLTPAVSRLCAVADQLTEKHGKNEDHLIRQSLRREVVLAWDGTGEGANSLFRVLKEFQRMRKVRSRGAR